MDYLATLSKTLLDLALGFLKIKSDDKTRQRLADTLTQIASCISTIADSVEAGTHPTKHCAELDAYIAHLESFVERETDAKTARTLTIWLRHVGDVPGLAKIDIKQAIESATKPKWSRHHRHEQAESIRHVAGLVEGIANLIRI